MKKILLALFVLLSLNAFAQFDGTPFYFCTLYGEQYNPGKHNTFQTGNIQGVLELKNGATIENAVCAVDLWNPLDEHSEGYKHSELRSPYLPIICRPYRAIILT